METLRSTPARAMCSHWSGGVSGDRRD